eukprot:jgi/Chlat1/5606/Chrsp369S00861
MGLWPWGGLWGALTAGGAEQQQQQQQQQQGGEVEAGSFSAASPPPPPPEVEQRAAMPDEGRAARQLRPRPAPPPPVLYDVDAVVKEMNKKKQQVNGSNSKRCKKHGGAGGNARTPEAQKKVLVIDDNDDMQPVSCDPEEVAFKWAPILKSKAVHMYPYRRYKGDPKPAFANASSQPSGDTPAICPMSVTAHFEKVEIDAEHEIHLNQTVEVQGEEGKDNFIGQVIEIFQTQDGQGWFRARWFWRFHDTTLGQAIGGNYASVQPDGKRVFIANDVDDNLLSTIVKPVTILRVPSSELKPRQDQEYDYWYNMQYDKQYTSFFALPDCLKELEHPPLAERPPVASRLALDTQSASDATAKTAHASAADQHNGKEVRVLKALDLYCGCGGLSIGFQAAGEKDGIEIRARWAVDMWEPALDTYRRHHPETKVYHMKAEHFLSLCKHFKRLCARYLDEVHTSAEEANMPIVPGGNDIDELVSDSEDEEDDKALDDDEFEVEEILDIRIKERDTKKQKQEKEKAQGKKKRKRNDGKDEELLQVDDDDAEDDNGGKCKKETQIHDREGVLEFLIKWKGYGDEHNSWEPEEMLHNCPEKFKDFLQEKKISGDIPFPGDVDVQTGGPPCQGVSGFNRFRDFEEPLRDPKNYQMAVYVACSHYFKPSFVLMENVADILKFGDRALGQDGYLGRFAMQQLVSMNYQMRMGLIAAGAYGLPQFRLRCFVWGAAVGERLPPFPLPTHEVLPRSTTYPTKWSANLVGWDEGSKDLKLLKELRLEDAMRDLPPVDCYEKRDEMPYLSEPLNDFQRILRRPPPGDVKAGEPNYSNVLYDHLSLPLSADDNERVALIPHRKGANWTDLPGGIKKEDGRYECGPNKVKSGKPLIPKYATSFENGRSKKPFARLWWDDIVPTVVTRAEPHNQCILHPEQDRVLSVRENARIQGFPDYYRLYGRVRDRYTQVGNAVAPPVARALCMALVQSIHGYPSEEPVLRLSSVAW